MDNGNEQARHAAEERIDVALEEGERIGRLLAHLDNQTRATTQGLVALGSTGNQLAFALVGRLVDVGPGEAPDVLSKLRRDLVQVARVLIASDAAEAMSIEDLADLDPAAARLLAHAQAGVDSGQRIPVQVGDEDEQDRTEQQATVPDGGDLP